jgi:hypothetical protein
MGDVSHILNRGATTSGGNGSESRHHGGKDPKDIRLSLSGGYLPQHSGGGGNTTIIINGSGTAEMLKVIDYAASRRDAHTNSVTRAPGGFGRYQFGTLGGL